MKPETLPKSPTGITGFDEISGGGLPTGRPTLICGDAGSGKTLFSIEFLVKGATQFNEPGVFISFEETEKELATNVVSLGFNLEELIAEKKIAVDHVYIERSEISEAGEFDLDGLFVRLNLAIEMIGAKRVVLDTIETLFGGLPNELIIRAELRRLFRWLKGKGVTVVITGERGEGTYTRFGIEEYVSDCVIVLDHRILNQLSTRRIRIAKYRGSAHGTNEYPFLIDENGFSVMPITSVSLNHKVSTDRVSSGIPELDEMMESKGFFKGSSILVSGTAGTGKSSLAAHFIESVCKRGERVLFFALEESPNQILRNMKTIGNDLEPWVNKGLLKFHAVRPTFYGLEMHLVVMLKEIMGYKPDSVIIDPLNSFISQNNQSEAKAMAIRLIDYLKMNRITGFFTSLTNGYITNIESTDIFISSLIDTWILLKDIEINGERNRGLYILKSRGMGHSNQIREFNITSEGIKLRKTYSGVNGVLTKSARLADEIKENTLRLQRKHELEKKQMELEQKRKAMEAQILAIKEEFETEKIKLENSIELSKLLDNNIVEERNQMSNNRK